MTSVKQKSVKVRQFSTHQNINFPGGDKVTMFNYWKTNLTPNYTAYAQQAKVAVTNQTQTRKIWF